MAQQYSQVHVRIERKGTVVQGMGQTGRGQKFIKKSEQIKSPIAHGKEFKEELAAAMDKLFT